MTDNRSTTALEIAGVMRSSLSRRRILQAAGIGGVALAAAACGTGGDDTASATGAPSAAAAADLSDTEKVANWSNWPLYIDIDEESGKRPSLEAFQAATGVAVTYTEDVNDNNGTRETMMDAACTSMPWARTTSSAEMDPRMAAPRVFDGRSKLLLNQTLLSHSSLAAFCLCGSVCLGL